MMKLITFFFVLFICILSVPGWSQTYYVDGTNGNDLWDGLSPVYLGSSQGPKQTLRDTAMTTGSSNGPRAAIQQTSIPTV